MNRYPMKARIDGQIVRSLRLVADDHSSTVWGWDRDAGTATELLHLDAPPERVGATTSWKVGDIVLDEQRGCGCNHPMYTWTPPDSDQASEA